MGSAVRAEVYLEPSRTSTMERFCKVVNGCEPLSLSVKKLYRFVYVRLGFK